MLGLTGIYIDSDVNPLDVRIIFTFFQLCDTQVNTFKNNFFKVKGYPIKVCVWLLNGIAHFLNKRIYFFLKSKKYFEDTKSKNNGKFLELMPKNV